MRALLEDQPRSRQRPGISRHHTARCRSRARMGQAFRAQRVRRGRLLWGPLSVLAISFAALAFALDQCLKWWLLHVFDIAARAPVAIFPVFDVVLAWNRGISYGWLTSHARQAQWLLIAVSI